MACIYKENRCNTGSPMGSRSSVLRQPAFREERAGPDGVAERAVVVVKPGNAGGAKGPWSETGARSDERGGD